MLLRRPGLRLLTAAIGLALLIASAVYLRDAVHVETLRAAAAALVAAPLPLLAALGAYAAAFGLRTVIWSATLPGLSRGQAWSALHLSLLGNHVLPLRLGEALRVTSVLRRTALPAREVVVSSVVLRLADVLAVLVLSLVAAPHLLLGLGGGVWVWAGLATLGLLFGGAVSVLWRMPALRRPGWPVAVATLLAWVLEAGVVLAVAEVSGVWLSPLSAVAVTALTIAAQTVAVTPGGFGTYEAVATAALVSLGVPAGPAFAVALLTHAVKTVYSLVTGLVAVVVPSPSCVGRFRLPRRLPPRPAACPVDVDAPVVVVIPVYNEAATVAAVVRGLPREVSGRGIQVLVVDDGSTDDSAARARAAGATVVSQPANLGLGAAVRRGLAEASARRPAAVVYLDADLEYDPAELPLLAAPVLAGAADYVVGSRFSGRITSMQRRRRLGNRVLTGWVRWMTRRRDLTDGQSGYRAFSPAAAHAARIVHDYNYAQVLTLDLLGQGFVYAEVPIGYAFRSQGESFVRLGRYLRRVVPAVHRQLNPAAAQSSTR